MKIKNLFIALMILLGATAGIVWAADHIDAPSVASTSSDITDYYAFQSPQNSSNMVFVANLQGLLDPTATASASFDEQVMVEFNIDNTGDAVEDLVIQAIFNDGKVQVYGPVQPMDTGLESRVETTGTFIEADITRYGNSPMIGENAGIKVFAGPRDDPFFMDFAQYGEIIAGNATSFNNPGSDTFAGTNVMSVVIEVPKSMLGTAETLNTWVESKRKI
jgi:hypothetical protein